MPPTPPDPRAGLCSCRSFSASTFGYIVETLFNTVETLIYTVETRP
jgi:hypothetical protein